VNLLLDTCAISELRKPRPSARFSAWFESCDERLFYLSSITLGELRYGMDLLPAGKRKTKLLTWYAQVCLSYRGHIVTPSLEVCELWGEMRARRQQMGQPLGMADGLIAASALAAGMALVTRNTNDFEGLGIEILNPWRP
jgi:toxin FitB